MPWVTYQHSDETSDKVDVPVGTSVMRAALANDVRGIVGECGGELMCATCHVYVLTPRGLDPELSEDELVGNLVNLVFAGMGTTTRQLASAVHDIVVNGRWEHLHAHPEDLAATINECLRFSPVTQFVVRIAQQDAEFGGLHYPKGTRVILNLLAASRDPEKFPDPDRFDITRVNDESRLPFGWGVHRCLGQPLARLLIEEGLKLLTSRLTDVAVVAREHGPHPTEMLSGPGALTLTFSRR